MHSILYKQYTRVLLHSIIDILFNLTEFDFFLNTNSRTSTLRRYVKILLE